MYIVNSYCSDIVLTIVCTKIKGGKKLAACILYHATDYFEPYLPGIYLSTRIMNPTLNSLDHMAATVHL